MMILLYACEALVTARSSYKNMEQLYIWVTGKITKVYYKNVDIGLCFQI